MTAARRNATSMPCWPPIAPPINTTRQVNAASSTAVLKKFPMIVASRSYASSRRFGASSDRRERRARTVPRGFSVDKPSPRAYTGPVYKKAIDNRTLDEIQAMLIRVADIPDEGLQVDGVDAFPHPFRDSSWSLDDVSLLVSKDEDIVLVRGHLAASVPQLCSRCLESYALDIQSEVDARFVPRPEGRSEEHELGGDDLESDVYDNGVIDLDALLE